MKNLKITTRIHLDEYDGVLTSDSKFIETSGMIQIDDLVSSLRAGIDFSINFVVEDELIEAYQRGKCIQLIINYEGNEDHIFNWIFENFRVIVNVNKIEYFFKIGDDFIENIKLFAIYPFEKI